MDPIQNQIDMEIVGTLEVDREGSIMKDSTESDNGIPDIVSQSLIN